MNSRFLPIYILTIINGLSMMLLFPVLPALIKQYDQPTIMLGVLVASYSLFQLIGGPILGALSDKYGRKPILLITQLGTFLSWGILALAYTVEANTIIMGISGTIFVTLLSRIMDGITGGNASVANAMIADLTTPQERSVVFGKNGAILGGTLIIGPALGSFSLQSEYGFLGTAILGGIFSALALVYMWFSLQESLSGKKHELKISFQNLNLYSQIQKWGSNFTVKTAIISKIFFFTGFFIYTTVSPLYLMDYFGFTETNVGYYLAFTGMFLVIHQLVSLPKIIKKTGDVSGFFIGQAIMAVGYWSMAASENIIVFTGAYFFGVLGISLSMNTIQSIFSGAADEKSQGEIMGMATGIESILMIIGPLLGTYLYSFLPFSIYWAVGIFPMITVVLYFIYFRKRLER